jgi:excinuclease UvrABC nuclease subunit
MSRWIISPEADHYDLPKEPAVYTIFCEGQLFYVGSSRNLKKRIQIHGVNCARYSLKVETPWGIFKEVTIKYRKETRYGEAAMAELRLIRKLNPKMNKANAQRH